MVFNCFSPESINEAIPFLNGILEETKSKFQILNLFSESSGQRWIFDCQKKDQAPKKYICKISQYSTPTIITRIQREIRILKQINSKHFPKCVEDNYCSRDLINRYMDSLTESQCGELESLGIRAFFYTIEEYVANIGWNLFMKEHFHLRIFTNIFSQVIQGLSILWSNKAIHRDIKPDNILIRPDFSPVIIDLAAAKSLRPETAQLTRGLGPKTAHFCSPEQINSDFGEVSYKSDQYSLGTTMYYLLSGNFPYGNPSEIGEEGLLEAMSGRKPTPIEAFCPDLPISLRNLIHKMIEVDPFRRFRTTESIGDYFKLAEAEIQ